jgi:hypothetical protein
MKINGRLMKKTLTIFAALLILGSSLNSFGEDVRKASFVLVEFYPSQLQAMVPSRPYST